MPNKPALLFILVLGALAGCASSGKSTFDRHAMSRLYPQTDGDGLVFEASVSADYPASSLAAEAERMKWLEQWLVQRKLCASGFDIEDRVAIGSAADNPYHHDLRYVLSCRDAAAK